MKIIYVAGKFRAPNAWETELNIRKAEEVAIQIWKAGAACICPHTNTRFFDGAVPNDVFLEGDLDILDRCDAIFMLDNWRDSDGAVGEHMLACIKPMPVLYSIREFLHYLEELDE